MPWDWSCARKVRRRAGATGSRRFRRFFARSAPAPSLQAALSGFRAHAIEQVRAVETRQVHGGIAQCQLRNDVGSHARRGGGGKGQDGYQRMPAAQSG